MRWTRCRRRRTPDSADGEVVWSWRPAAGGKPVMVFRIKRQKVARKPGHLGEREVSRKPSRRESRRCSGSPVVRPPCFFCCTGPTGAHGTRLSLRPLLDEGVKNDARLGHSCREDAGVCLRCCLTIESVSV